MARRRDVRARRPVLGELHDRLARLARRAAARDGRRRRAVDGAVHAGLRTGLRGADLAAAPWREIVIQAVFQGVLSAIVALLLYTRAVAILGAARGAVFAALVPTFSLLIAIPLLHETPTELQLVGVAFVTAGYGVRARPARPREMAFAAYAGSAAMKSTMRLRSAASGRRPRAAVMLSTM